MSWFKEGKPITKSKSLKLSEVGGVHTLRMAKAAVKDSGEYTCTATNDSGAVFCTVTVNITGKLATVVPSTPAFTH